MYCTKYVRVCVCVCVCVNGFRQTFCRHGGQTTIMERLTSQRAEKD